MRSNFLTIDHSREIMSFQSPSVAVNAASPDLNMKGNAFFMQSESLCDYDLGFKMRACDLVIQCCDKYFVLSLHNRLQCLVYLKKTFLKGAHTRFMPFELGHEQLDFQELETSLKLQMN